jgi:GNAT superfamily N-acetyltransferase
MDLRFRCPTGAVRTQTSGPELIPIDPSPDDVQYLEDRIYEFNSRVTSIAGGEWLAIFVRDERDCIVAGICGNTWGGVCEIRQFWVEESRRHRGLGTELFLAAEREARRRGCTQMLLMTFSFQAPAFYQRNGFEVVRDARRPSPRAQKSSDAKAARGLRTKRHEYSRRTSAPSIRCASAID